MDNRLTWNGKVSNEEMRYLSKLRTKPLEQIMGQMPKLRVPGGLAAFRNTAIDMFGPFQIKLNRRTVKEAQVIIFTCMTTRAVHLELVTDRSADTFFSPFRRSACLRGHASTCWSDCGTNFVGAQSYMEEIMREWDIPRIQSILSDEFSSDFKWKWNIPHSSHQNGVVESVIKPVRQAFNFAWNPLSRRSNGLTVVRCILVLATFGNFHRSRRTIFLLAITIHHQHPTMKKMLTQEIWLEALKSEQTNFGNAGLNTLHRISYHEISGFEQGKM